MPGVIVDEQRSPTIPRWAVRAGAVVVIGVLVVHVVLTQVKTMGRTVHLLAQPRWGWLAVAGAACVLTHLMGAVAMSGATPIRLRLGPTFSVQFACSFCNRLAPAGLGGMATNARYLECCGLDRPAAVGAVGLNAFAGFVIHALLIAIVVPIAAPGVLAHTQLPVRWLVIGAVLGCAAIGLAVVGIRAAQPQLGAKIMGAARGLVETVRIPRRAAALLGGSAGITAAYGVALAASLWAFGVHIGLLRVITVLLVTSAVTALSPTPGGVGVLEPALIAALAAVSGPVAPVAAGVVMYRLATYWLPVVPGAAVLVGLRRRNLL